VWQAIDLGALMVGMDFSRAIGRAGELLSERKGVVLVQGDIERPPFRLRSFDFVYSFGVLHHMPDPERGFRALVPLVSPGGAIFVWVYSNSRRMTTTLLEAVRRVTSRLPHGVTRALSLGGALVDWAGFVMPYRLARRVAPPA